MTSCCPSRAVDSPTAATLRMPPVAASISISNRLVAELPAPCRQRHRRCRRATQVDLFRHPRETKRRQVYDRPDALDR